MCSCFPFIISRQVVFSTPLPQTTLDLNNETAVLTDKNTLLPKNILVLHLQSVLCLFFNGEKMFDNMYICTFLKCELLLKISSLKVPKLYRVDNIKLFLPFFC